MMYSPHQQLCLYLFGKYGPQIPWFIIFATKVALNNCRPNCISPPRSCSGASLALQALLVLYENESCEVTIAMLRVAVRRSGGSWGMISIHILQAGTTPALMEIIHVISPIFSGQIVINDVKY